MTENRQCSKCGMEFEGYSDCETKGVPSHTCLNDEEVEWVEE